jgi:cobalt-zinc-cadmium efflux system outer membrane protein
LIPRPTRTPVLLTSPARRIATLALVGLGACAPRGVPSTFVTTPPAAESPPPRVAVMLAEDPPLPGEDTSLWPGLEPADAPVADPHAHHRHPPSAGSPAPTPAAPQAAAAAPKAAAKPMNAGAALTVEEAVRLALLNNRALRASLRELGVAKGQLVQAGLLPNPAVSRSSSPRPGGAQRQAVLSASGSSTISPTPSSPRSAPSAARADVEAARYRSAAAVVVDGLRGARGVPRGPGLEQRLAIASACGCSTPSPPPRRLPRPLRGGQRRRARRRLAGGRLREAPASTVSPARARAARSARGLAAPPRSARRARPSWKRRGHPPARRLSSSTCPCRSRGEGPRSRASLELAEAAQPLEGSASRRTGLARTEGWPARRRRSVVRGRAGRPGLRRSAAARTDLPPDLRPPKQGTIAGARGRVRQRSSSATRASSIDLRSAAREARAIARHDSPTLRARHLSGGRRPGAKARARADRSCNTTPCRLGVFQLLAGAARAARQPSSPTSRRSASSGPRRPPSTRSSPGRASGYAGRDGNASTLGSRLVPGNLQEVIDMDRREFHRTWAASPPGLRSAQGRIQRLRPDPELRTMPP